MAISMQSIQDLRKATDAPIVDCKKALEQNDGDIQKAIQWLREKGIAKAAKKASAVATEGRTGIVVNKNTAYVFELNCQTDFTSNNDNFVAIDENIKKALATSNIKSVEEARQIKLSTGETVEMACTNATAKIGEKIELRRLSVLTKESNDIFGVYVHSNFRFSASVVLKDCKDANGANGIAMHAGGLAPKFIDSTSVDQKWLESERKITVERTIAEGKPADKAEMIAKGRVQKMLSEICLVDQDYVRDASKKVGDYAKSISKGITQMVRFEVGEGIEKEESNFAEEVAKQVAEAQKGK